jgi:hypothetical protein
VPSDLQGFSNPLRVTGGGQPGMGTGWQSGDFSETRTLVTGKGIFVGNVTGM